MKQVIVLSSFSEAERLAIMEHLFKEGCTICGVADASMWADRYAIFIDEDRTLTYSDDKRYVAHRLSLPDYYVEADVSFLHRIDVKISTLPPNIIVHEGFEYTRGKRQKCAGS